MRYALIAVLLMTAPSYTTAGPAPDERSAARNFLYGKSGDWLQEGLRQLRLPPLRPTRAKEGYSRLPVDWMSKITDSREWAPLLDVSAVDYRTGRENATAYMAAFPVSYWKGGKGLLDDYFAQIRASKSLPDRIRAPILEHEALQRRRASVFHLAFDRSRVQVVHYPGEIYFKGGDRSRMKEWLPGVPADIKEGTRTDHALIQDSRGLLALLNGTFDKTDNFVGWNHRGPTGFAGFGYDFRTYLPPQDGMATFALYEDGRVELGTYRNLPEKGRIRAFVQNRFMVLEDGATGKDADPLAFRSYHDNIARAYLFTDRRDRIGYLWTLYTPTKVLVPIALELGITDMMLLDIHSPLSCSIADPEGPLVFGSWRDYMERSYDLVPNFFRLSPMRSTLTWISTALESRIQTHYPQEAFRIGAEDYFAVFLKDSPEALRVRAPRSAASAAAAGR